MKKLFALTALLFCLALAQPISIIDEPSIDELLETFSEGVPSDSEVASLEAQAIELLRANDCSSAIPVLESWAKSANHLSNLYRQTLEPFYSTTRYEREDSGFYLDDIEELIDNEDTANNYVRERNTAWVYLGECHMRAGDYPRAISYFSQALEYISLGEEELPLWKRAAEGIMSIVQR